MSRCLRLCIGLVSMGAAVACGPSANVEQERAALMAADRAWSETTKDPGQWAAYFADGASIYPPGMGVITGSDAIKKSFTEMSAAPGFSLSWTPTKADVGAAGDVGYTAGAYQSTMGGVAEKGKYITVWKKQGDGAWKVTEDIFNADEAPKAASVTHAMVPASALKWGEPPPGLPAGMRAAVVSGDPGQAGQPYVLRAQMPANYRIPPHWHPTTENVTVLSGTVALGMGETFNESAMQVLPVGGFTSVPAEMRHFFTTKTAATIQVHGIGPFGITYLNPADDPRTKKSN